MFWFMLVALVVVAAAVALAMLGDGGVLPEAEPDRFEAPMPDDRPVHRSDVDELRLPVAVRGYRMTEVDDALDRLGAELAERDARIAELEAVLAGVQDSALGSPALSGGAGAAAAPPQDRRAGAFDAPEDGGRGE